MAPWYHHIKPELSHLTVKTLYKTTPFSQDSLIFHELSHPVWLRRIISHHCVNKSLLLLTLEPTTESEQVTPSGNVRDNKTGGKPAAKAPAWRLTV